MKNEHLHKLVAELRRHGAHDIGIEHGGRHPRINFTYAGRRQFYVAPHTPSDYRSGLNSLADLRRMIGVTHTGQPREAPIELPPPEEAPRRTEEFLQGYARGVEEGEGRHRKQHALEVSRLNQHLEAARARRYVTPEATATVKRPALVAEGDRINLELPESGEEDAPRATLFLTACLLLWSTNQYRAGEIIDEFFGEEEQQPNGGRHAA